VCADDPLFRIVDLGQRIIPDILRKQGKAKDPNPNVDWATGSLLHHFGLTELDYFTVVFGVSRALGMLAQLVLNLAIGTPITRPKSVSSQWIKAQVAAAG